MKKYKFLTFVITIFALFFIFSGQAGAVQVPTDLSQVAPGETDAWLVYQACVIKYCEPIKQRPVSCTSGSCQYDGQETTWDQANNSNEYKACIQDCDKNSAATKQVKATPDSSVSAGVADFKLNTPIGSMTSISVDPSKNALGQYIRVWYGFLIGIAGILATLMIMFAGVKWMTSRGDTGAIGESKQIMIAALTGLALAFLSYSILALINPGLLTIKMPKLDDIKYTGNFSFPAVNMANVARVNSNLNLPTITDPTSRGQLFNWMSTLEEGRAGAFSPNPYDDANSRPVQLINGQWVHVDDGTPINGNPTIGVGHSINTGPDLLYPTNQTWTEEMALAQYQHDMETLGDASTSIFGNTDNPARNAALMGLTFQYGPGGVQSSFPGLREAIQSDNWTAAADIIQRGTASTAWSARGAQEAQMIRDGAWPAGY